MFTKLALALFLALTLTSSALAAVWEEVASIPGTGRHHPINFVLNGHGYVATGTTPVGGSSDDFYRYDPVADSWTVLPDFPGPDRSYGYGGAFNGKGYLGFGVGTAYLRDLWEYDPVSEGWTELAICPGVGRTHPAFVITDDGKIFVGMGGSVGGNLRDWWEYDIATNQWTQRADLTGPMRHHPYYFNIGTVPYVGFGHGTAIFKDVYRFNRGFNTWTRMIDFPAQGRVAGQQFSHQGKGYVLSGQGATHNYLPTGEFWEYEPTDDSWTQLTPHPGTGRWAPGSFVIGTTLYFMAGETAAQMERDMWKYEMLDPAGIGETTLANDVSFTPYPNPVTSQQIRLLNLPSKLDVATIHLLSADGRQISELASQSATIQLPQHLVSGQYFLSLSTKDGSRHTRQITVLR